MACTTRAVFAAAPRQRTCSSPPQAGTCSHRRGPPRWGRRRQCFHVISGRPLGLLAERGLTLKAVKEFSEAVRIAWPPSSFASQRDLGSGSGCILRTVGHSPRPSLVALTPPIPLKELTAVSTSLPSERKFGSALSHTCPVPSRGPATRDLGDEQTRFDARTKRSCCHSASPSPRERAGGPAGPGCITSSVLKVRQAEDRQGLTRTQGRLLVEELVGEAPFTSLTQQVAFRWATSVTTSVPCAREMGRVPGWCVWAAPWSLGKSVGLSTLGRFW